MTGGPGRGAGVEGNLRRLVGHVKRDFYMSKKATGYVSLESRGEILTEILTAVFELSATRVGF